MTNDEALETVIAMLGKRDPRSMAEEAMSVLTLALAELEAVKALLKLADSDR